MGQSKNVTRRFYEHKSELLREKHANRYLQNVSNKHGFDKLEFSVVEEVSKEELCQRESFWMDALNPECNLMVVRDSDGTEHTDEWKKNMSINNPSKRPEVKKMRAEQLMKYNPSRDNESVREKIRVAALKQFAEKGHPMIGRKLSAETKAKISASQRVRLAKSTGQTAFASL